MHDHAAPSPASSWPAAVTAGFAGVLAMWSVGFVARLPGVQAPAMLVADAFGAIQLTAGAVVGGLVGRRAALKTGALTGLVSGVANLLVVGSLVSDASRPNSLRQEWPLFLGLCLLGAPIVAMVGAGAGAAMRPRKAAAPGAAINWHGWFAAICALATLALLVIGGLVTSLEAGLAVPDWPNSFGYNMFLLPLEQMQGGVYFEHTHRLFGTLVGLCVLTLVLFTFLADKRPRIRALSVLALVLVAAQGVLGGMRVTGKPTLSQTDVAPNLGLALVHGVSGQAVFALLCIIACIASDRWKRDDPPAQSTPPGSPRTIAMALLIALLAQLVLGAIARHFDQSKGYLHVVGTHAVNALVVAGLAVVAGARAKRALPGRSPMTRLGTGLVHAVGLQILLGAAALWVIWGARAQAGPPSGLEAALATAHQTLGALLLGMAAMLAAWSRRLTLPRR